MNKSAKAIFQEHLNEIKQRIEATAKQLLQDEIKELALYKKSMLPEHRENRDEILTELRAIGAHEASKRLSVLLRLHELATEHGIDPVTARLNPKSTSDFPWQKDRIAQRLIKALDIQPDDPDWKTLDRTPGEFTAGFPIYVEFEGRVLLDHEKFAEVSK
jgi:hypothetical protein